MTIPWLEDEDPFPSPALAPGPGSEWSGLVGMGGGLSPARLERAYRLGIFPWYSGRQPVLWWSPDPRMVLPVDAFRLHRSLKKVIQRFLDSPQREIRFSHDVGAVLKACAGGRRGGPPGTWITPAMQRAYRDWHRLGRVQTVETWAEGRLIGGLYGVWMGRMFFGESMFSHQTDASKIALAALVAACRRLEIPWIDCQQNTSHLASLGAREVSRAAFLAHLAAHVDAPASVDSAPVAREWAYHSADWNLLGLRPPGG